MVPTVDGRQAWKLICSMFYTGCIERAAGHGADFVPIWEMLSNLGAIKAANYPRTSIECERCEEIAELGYDASGNKVYHCPRCRETRPATEERLRAWSLDEKWLARHLCFALGLDPRRCVTVIKGNAILLGQIRPSKSETPRPVFLARNVLAIIRRQSDYDALKNYGCDPVVITADRHLKDSDSPLGMTVLKLQKMFFLSDDRVCGYEMNLSATVFSGIPRPVYGPFSRDFLLYFEPDGGKIDLTESQAKMLSNLNSYGDELAKAEDIMPEGVTATKPIELFKVSSKGKARTIEKKRLAIYKRHVSCPNRRLGEYHLVY